jgi:hypothetical protein
MIINSFPKSTVFSSYKISCISDQIFAAKIGYWEYILRTQSEFHIMSQHGGQRPRKIVHDLHKMLSKISKKCKFWFDCAKFELFVNDMQHLSLKCPFMPASSNEFTIVVLLFQSWFVLILRKPSAAQIRSCKEFEILEL